jgi:hypothetical protein
MAQATRSVGSREAVDRLADLVMRIAKLSD